MKHLRQALLLALTGVITFAVLTVTLELAARRIFRRSDTTVWSCFVPDSGGIRARDNSVCWEKMPESPLVEYRFNACGHRSTAACGAKPAGSRRLVLIGSSFVMGYQAAYDRIFPVLLQKKLAERGRNIEIDNQGIVFGTPRRTALHFDEALATTPDWILWTVTPWDIHNASKIQEELPLAKVDREGGPPPPKLRRIWGVVRDEGIQTLVRNSSRAVLLLQHVLFQSPTQYRRNYLLRQDDRGLIARQSPPVWRQRWADLESVAAEMATRAKAAGVPFAVAAVPDRAEALMMSAGDWPPDLDPFAFGEQLRAITERHGGVYLDILPAFREERDAERMYYPVDGHMTSEGHAFIARVLADRMSGLVK
jgi:hypothetical protein